MPPKVPRKILENLPTVMIFLALFEQLLRQPLIKLFASISECLRTNPYDAFRSRIFDSYVLKAEGLLLSKRFET